MAQQGRSPEVDAELKKLQGVQNGQFSLCFGDLIIGG